MAKIHFIGIGGIGMSGLANIHLAKGSIVTGSDLRLNDLTDKLRGQGAAIYKGHRAHNIQEDTTCVVKSTCIRDNNPEIKKAQELGIPIIPRSEMLKNLMEESSLSVAVTGTHGKTTTSSLVAHIVDSSGKDPTVILGGEVERFGGNAKFGHGDIVIAEVDESDGHFRNLSATHAVVTNIEAEHMEHYGSLENLIDAYTEFIGKISPKGVFVFNGNDTILKHLTGVARARTVSFGIDGDFDVTCTNYSHTRSIEFELVTHGRNCGRVSSSLIGRYNLENVLAAIAICAETGFNLEGIKGAIASFSGVRRRFDLIREVGGIKVIEDYAHHPTELRAVIAAAKGYLQKGRVITIFQPHRYSRTRAFLHEFSNCFYDSDILILTDIYSADEDILEEVNLGDMYKAIDKSRFEKLDLLRKDAIPEFVANLIKDNDIVLVLGAGDIRDISGELVEKIEKQYAN